MSNPLNEMDTRSSFKVCLTLLRNITSVVVEDYPLTEDLTNHQFIYKYMGKSKLKILGGNLRGNLRYMKSLMSQDAPNYSDIAYRKAKLGKWHDLLTQKHMYHYSRNTTKDWNYLGLAIHYLLDAYYHIYTRMTASPSEATCFWCKNSLAKKWPEVLTDIITEHLPRVYLYLSLAQNGATKNKPLSKELLKTYFKEFQGLVHLSLGKDFLQTINKFTEDPEKLQQAVFNEMISAT
jgi:hypothetical protein